MKSKILGLLVAGLMALPLVGHAALVTISGQGSADGDWNVTTVSAAYSGSVPAGYTSQVWWGNFSLAGVFAQTLAGALGYPNKFQDNFGGVSIESYAPLFAYETSGGGCCGTLFSARTVRDDTGALALFQDVPRGKVYTWAVAERVTTSPPPVPLPAAAWLLLSGLGGLGLLGRRRKA